MVECLFVCGPTAGATGMGDGLHPLCLQTLRIPTLAGTVAYCSHCTQADVEHPGVYVQRWNELCLAAQTTWSPFMLYVEMPPSTGAESSGCQAQRTGDSCDQCLPLRNITRGNVLT